MRKELQPYVLAGLAGCLIGIAVSLLQWAWDLWDKPRFDDLPEWKPPTEEEQAKLRAEMDEASRSELRRLGVKFEETK